MAAMSRPIEVAIVGGGLGGTVLMNALMTCPNISANIYEAKSTFKERGASVGLAVNAQRALELLNLGHVMHQAGAVDVDGGRCIMGEGPDEGKLVIDVPVKLATVHRAALLRELISTIPEDRMHVNKRMTSIENGKVLFEDGTSKEVDVVIGADGIHSHVRQYVLGKDHPGVHPIYAGIWDCRGVVPFETAKAKLGPERITRDNPRQTIYCSDGMLLFYDTIDDGKSIALLGAGLIPPDWDKEQWKQTVTRKWLYEQCENWPNFAKDMIDLLCGENDEIPTFIEWESGQASTLYNKTICLMGDAAHATTPWQGAGLGQAIEDALILKTVLSQCEVVDDIPAAFEVYDQLMRPRGQRVIDSSRRMGQLLLGIEGLDAQKIGDTMRPMWDFIHQWKTEEVVNDVVEKVRLAKSSKK